MVNFLIYNAIVFISTFAITAIEKVSAFNPRATLNKGKELYGDREQEK